MALTRFYGSVITWCFTYPHMDLCISFDSSSHIEKLCLWNHICQSNGALDIQKYVKNLLLRTSLWFFSQPRSNHYSNNLWTFWNLNFVLWLARISSFKKGAWSHITKGLNLTNLETLRKLVKTCHINLNSHAKFHGDRTIGGAITVKRALKNTIFV